MLTRLTLILTLVVFLPTTLLAQEVQPPVAPHNEEGTRSSKEHPAPAPTRDEWSPLAARFDTREAHIQKRFATIRLSDRERQAYLATLDLDALDFCTTFQSMDALGSKHFLSTGVPTWKTLWGKSAIKKDGMHPRFVSEIIALVEHCDYSRGATYRAAFLLEYMYWNRMIDRVGMEVADALEFRDHFYELNFIDIARDKIAYARGLPHSKPRTAGNFFAPQEMRLAFFLRFFGLLTNSFPPRRRRAYMAMIRTLDLRRGSMLMFGRDILQLLDEPEDLDIMIDFYDHLLHLRENPEMLGVGHGGWAKLMVLTRGDKARALRILTLLASLRGWVMEELADSLIPRGELTPKHLEAFYAGANAYFMMNQINERAATPGDDAFTLVYHFFYPPDFESTNWKTYHWYANAFLGCQLAEQGMDGRSTELATRRLAQAYEALTLNLAIPTKRAIGEEPRARAIIEGWEDVDINAEGGAYGWALCHTP